MSSKIRHAAYSITLDLDVGAKHLPDERFESAKLDDEQFVVS